jgi:hypothetical protein
MLIGSPAHAASAEEAPAADCRQYRKVAPDVYVQDFDSTDVTGGFAGLPDRVTTGLSAGQSGRVCVGFHNRTGIPATLRFRAHDVGASREGFPVPAAAGDEQYGAASWLTLPATDTVTIEHGELVWLDVAVDVPVDTAGGSAYAGISAIVADSEAREQTPDVQTQITPAVVVQVFFDVPGDITRGGRFEDVRSPRIVWWDGFEVGTIPELRRLRGSGVAPIRFGWSNDGSLSDEIGGAVKIESSLGGKEVARIRVPSRIVLRDATRQYETYWSKDIPFIGRFTPTLVMTDATGKEHTKQLDPIWVIPSWWYLLALVLAVGIPLWIRRRSKRRYRELLERVEAAEQRSYVEIDGDEDSWLDD